MASTAAASAGGGSDDDAKFSYVYQAIARGAGVEELRSVIEDCARGDDRHRADAVNYWSSTGHQSPLEAAHD